MEEKPVICECKTCQWRWLHGQDGSHSCTEHLLRRISMLEKELEMEKRSGMWDGSGDW